MERVSHRLAQKLIPGIKAQRKFLTTPNPVGYKTLTRGELDLLWNDPTGQGREMLRQQLPKGEWMKLEARMATPVENDQDFEDMI